MHSIRILLERRCQSTLQPAHGLKCYDEIWTLWSLMPNLSFSGEERITARRGGSAPGAPRHTGGLGEARGEAKRQFEREARGEGQRVPVACARCS